MKQIFVIGIVGRPGSGKSTALEALEKGKNAKIVCMGDRVREKVTQAGLPITPENLGKMAENLRKDHGPDVVAILTIEKIKEISRDGDLIIIDGIRSMHEVELFRKHWKMPLLALDSPKETRHARLRERKRDDDSMDEGYFNMRDERELNFGVGFAIDKASVTIQNLSSTTIAELQEEVINQVNVLMTALEGNE
ncbi:MAG: AAA family ATPase [Candidatus Hodarchaeota archaeon]